MSKTRLKSLMSKFKADKDLLICYDNIISEQLEAGVLEPAPSESIVGKTSYLPHKAVVKNDRETTKIRMVYDASTKDAGCIYL